MKHYVNGFYRSGDSVVLFLKAKPEWQKGRFNGVGGKVESGETAVEAMVREFKEEVGHQTTTDDWKHTVSLVGNDFVVYFFAASGSYFDIHPETIDGDIKEP